MAGRIERVSMGGSVRFKSGAAGTGVSLPWSPLLLCSDAFDAEIEMDRVADHSRVGGDAEVTSLDASLGIVA